MIVNPKNQIWLMVQVDKNGNEMPVRAYENRTLAKKDCDDANSKSKKGDTYLIHSIYLIK